MLIDWFTVGAQALNFVVLVWLLKRFLYQPVLDAIAAREGRIAAQLAQAAQTQRDAEALRVSLARQRDTLAQERESLLAQSAQQAEAVAARLLDAARQQADALLAQRRDTLRAEAGQLRRTLADGTRREVYAIAREALAELAGSSLQERLADVFVRRLQALDAPTRDALAAALVEPDKPALVRSADALQPASRAAVQAALDALARRPVAITFETAADDACAIELVVGGRRVAWGLEPWLAAMEDRAAAWMAAATPVQQPPAMRA